MENTTRAEPTPSGATLAVVLCAGQGSRMGAAQNKMFLRLAGEPVATHAIRAFERSPLIDEILVVAHPDELERVRAEIILPGGFTKVSEIVAGGATRHQSEERALDALRARIESGAVTRVLIHDGARPLTSGAEIAALIAILLEPDGLAGALLATPIAPDEHISSIDADGVVTRFYEAAELARAQTPQGFVARTLLAAYDRARAQGFEGTDTASVVEAAGAAVGIAWGDEANIKVTTPDDLLRAEATLRARAEQTPHDAGGGYRA